jgi:hypothetical protein
MNFLVGLGCAMFGAFIGAVLMALCASVKDHEPPIISSAFPRVGVYNPEGIAEEITGMLRRAGTQSVCRYDSRVHMFYMITPSSVAQQRTADATR